MALFRVTFTNVNTGTTTEVAHDFESLEEAQNYAAKYRRTRGRMGATIRVDDVRAIDRLNQTQLLNLIDSGEYGLEKLRNEYERVLGERCDRRFNAQKVCDRILTAYAAEDERRRIDAEREAETARIKAEYLARAEARKDFDAWSLSTRETDDRPERDLGRIMRKTYLVVDGFPEVLKTYQESVALDPHYALRWSGSFIEKVSEHRVAQYLVSMFTAGYTQEEMAREMLTGAMRAGSATSRSTSAMSNLVEDCDRNAYKEAYRLLTGDHW